MFSPNERAKIIALINREVVPAIGCTEPIAVALCTARAAELLDAQPEKIEVRLSANILKNAMGVGIPGTGMIGLPIAVALGALVGRSEYQLEVLRDVTPEAVGRGAHYIDEKRVCISLKEDISEKLYIEVEASAGERRAVAVIAGGHTAFVYLERDGEVLLDKRTASVAEEEAGEVPLTLRRVWDFAMTAPLDELRFILETRRVNIAAAERAFAGEFGHCVGRTLRCERERQVMGDSIFSRILSEYKEDGFDRVNPSILKSAVQADYPDFTERQIGLRRFSDVLRALEKEKLLKLETDEGGNMLVHIL